MPSSFVRNVALQRSIHYRAGQSDEHVRHGIHISINGIAAELRNIG